MFTKRNISGTEKDQTQTEKFEAELSGGDGSLPVADKTAPLSAPMPKAGVAKSTKKPISASVISSDLKIIGNLTTAGEVQVEGTVEGDIDANHVNIGESATIRGEIVADDIIVFGKIIGRVRGDKVRLSATARVEGDIIHRSIAIESGAHFEGSVQRSDSPLGGDRDKLYRTEKVTSGKEATTDGQELSEAS